MMNTGIERTIDILLRSRVTLIILITSEEERAVQSVRNICIGVNPARQCVSWDIADGFSTLAGNPVSLPQKKDPLSALDDLGKTEENAVIILRDFHEFWSNPAIKRKLRNCALSFRFSRRSILITTPVQKVPDEIRDDAVVLHFPLPSSDELGLELDSILRSSGARSSLTPLGREKLIQAALGMTMNQARRSFSKAIVTRGYLDDRDIDAVIDDKKGILTRSEALEFHGAAENPDNVGGLAVLKEWLRLRERAFTHEAHAYGLPSPKGIALIGIPGTGKSLTAKMIAGLWKLPLIRLDAGALFGSLVGESEERTRRALHLAETVAPCILWVDEIEKAFAFGNGDSGTSQRVFAHLLTWMQDKTAPCFVVATANNISALPPELLRKGRFDEIFFLDLPVFEERREIFSVHLRKRKCLPSEFDLDLLAKASDGFVGAEIEQAIIDAMYRAFNEGMRPLATEDIMNAMQAQVPLSRSQRETVDGLRAWLREGRAISASVSARSVPRQNPGTSPGIQLDPLQTAD